MEDSKALTLAFKDVEGAFILPPSCFDPKPGFPEAQAVITAVTTALLLARPKKVVCLSTIGAQATQSNLLTQRTLMEQALSSVPMPVTFLRPGWFMENAVWDVASARERGILSSYLQPLDKPVPMVATADVGGVAAELIQQYWEGKRIVELTGPKPVSPNDLADTLGKALGRDVHAEQVPRETWGSLFLAQGMNDPIPRIQMLDGFNEGWICFEHPDRVLNGKVTLEEVVRKLCQES
jgi:uncharacterized protein YbjT (DUF2867 family)